MKDNPVFRQECLRRLFFIAVGGRPTRFRILSPDNLFALENLPPGIDRCLAQAKMLGDLLKKNPFISQKNDFNRCTILGSSCDCRIMLSSSFFSKELRFRTSLFRGIHFLSSSQGKIVSVHLTSCQKAWRGITNWDITSWQIVSARPVTGKDRYHGQSHQISCGENADSRHCRRH